MKKVARGGDSTNKCRWLRSSIWISITEDELIPTLGFRVITEEKHGGDSQGRGISLTHRQREISNQKQGL